MKRKLRVEDFLSCKKNGNKITMITAYDTPSAQFAEQAGIDVILVGDSLSMTVLGLPSTHKITLNEMLHHTRAVVRGATNTFIIGDMPINTYNDPTQALESARQFITAGCDAVKIEGPGYEIVKSLYAAGIATIGHIGLTPQSFEVYTVVGKSEEEKKRLLEEATRLEKENIVLLVLESMPATLGKIITNHLTIPVIGIGAGPDCDGQVLVLNDILGIFKDFSPKYVRRYADIATQSIDAIKSYIKDVRDGAFPSLEESYEDN